MCADLSARANQIHVLEALQAQPPCVTCADLTARANLEKGLGEPGAVGRAPGAIWGAADAVETRGQAAMRQVARKRCNPLAGSLQLLCRLLQPCFGASHWTAQALL